MVINWYIGTLWQYMLTYLLCISHCNQYLQHKSLLHVYKTGHWLITFLFCNLRQIFKQLYVHHAVIMLSKLELQGSICFIFRKKNNLLETYTAVFKWIL